MSTHTPVSVRTDEAPQAIGPYSQGIAAGDTLFISGQLPLAPDGRPVFEPIGEACTQALSNVEAVLAAAGEGWQLVQVRIYLRSMEDYPAVNTAYESRMSAPFPARAVVEVSGLPKDAPLEIEATAVRIS